MKFGVAVLLLLMGLAPLGAQASLPSLAVSPSLGLFATGDLSGTVLVRETVTGELVATKAFPLTRGITALRFDTNAPALTVLTASGAGFVWNWLSSATTELPFQPAGWKGAVPGSIGLFLTQTGLVSSAAGKVLFPARAGVSLTAVAVSPDGLQLVCSWSDSVVELRESKTGRVTLQWPPSAARSLQVFWSPAGIVRTLASNVVALTTAQGAVLAQWSLPGPSSSLTATATAWFAGTRDGSLVTAESSPGAVPVFWGAHEGPVTALAVAGDGLLSVGSEGTVGWWGFPSGDLRGRLGTGTVK